MAHDVVDDLGVLPSELAVGIAEGVMIKRRHIAEVTS